MDGNEDGYLVTISWLIRALIHDHFLYLFNIHLYSPFVLLFSPLALGVLYTDHAAMSRNLHRLWFDPPTVAQTLSYRQHWQVSNSLAIHD